MNYPKWLGLKKEERQILSAISKRGSLGVSEISRKTRIPRTTLYNYIKSLSVRGLVSTKKDGRENLVVPHYNHNIFWSQSSGDFNMIGKEDFTRAYLQLEQHKNLSRVRWIQPSGVLKIITEKYSSREIIQVNQTIKKSGAIVECILEEDYYQSFEKLLSSTDLIGVTESLYGRPYDAYIIGKDVLDPYTEILLLDDGVIILNWKFVKGMYTENPAINSFFNSYFDSLKNKSKKINVSEILASYLRKK